LLCQFATVSITAPSTVADSQIHRRNNIGLRYW